MIRVPERKDGHSSWDHLRRIICREINYKVVVRVSWTINIKGRNVGSVATGLFPPLGLAGVGEGKEREVLNSQAAFRGVAPFRQEMEAASGNWRGKNERKNTLPSFTIIICPSDLLLGLLTDARGQRSLWVYPCRPTSRAERRKPKISGKVLMDVRDHLQYENLRLVEQLGNVYCVKHNQDALPVSQLSPDL